MEGVSAAVKYLSVFSSLIAILKLWLYSLNFIFDDKVVGFLVPKNRAVDIDDKYDFEYALLLKRKKLVN